MFTVFLTSTTLALKVIRNFQGRRGSFQALASSILLVATKVISEIPWTKRANDSHSASLDSATNLLSSHKNLYLALAEIKKSRLSS